MASVMLIVEIAPIMLVVEDVNGTVITIGLYN